MRFSLNLVKSHRIRWDFCWIWVFLTEEDKTWDKAWRAQQAHVHGPIKGQAHSLCGAPDRMRAQTCPPRFRFLKTCSVRKGLGPQGQDLLYKDKTCSTRRRLALQGKDLGHKKKTCSVRIRLVLQGEDLHYKERSKGLTTIKAPTSSSHKEVRVTNFSLAL